MSIMKCALLLVLGLCLPLLADVVTLSDGTKIEGDIKREGNDYRITTADGKSLLINENQVTGIELKRRATGDDRPSTLRRSVENLGDINQIIDRYQKFIEQNKNAPFATEAQKDLDLWKQRKDQNMTKVAGRWVSPNEREELRAKAASVADQARALIKQNQLKEADALLNDALARDPANASALYLRGYLALKNDQLLAARKAFEAVNQLTPHHAPTLNNLAITLFRMNQRIPAMSVYDQAMAAKPQDVRILTNVAEALHVLAGNELSGDIVKRATKRFNDQESLLESEMLTQGYKRWGSGYISREEYDRFDQEAKQNEEKIAANQNAQTKINLQRQSIQQSIEQDQESMRRLENSRLGATDSQGRPVLLPLPQEYYDLQNDVRRLTRESGDLHLQLLLLQKETAREQRNDSAKKYSGIQTPFGEDGTPLAYTASPSTQSTIAPSKTEQLR